LPSQGRKLAAENNHFLRRLDGIPYTIALHGSVRDANIVANVNGLSRFPAQYQHQTSSMKGLPFLHKLNA
jgi:hypothetical protein